MSKVDRFFQCRSLREKILLIVVMFILFLSGYFKGMVFPMEKRIMTLQHQFWQIQRHAFQITANAARLNGFAAFLRERTSRERLSQIPGETAPQYGVRITHTDEEQDNVEIGIEPVHFNTLLAWLNALRNTYGIVVTELDLTATNEPGEVNVQKMKIKFI